MNELSGWTPRPFPERKTLDGRYCRLEPLNVERHSAELTAAFTGAEAAWLYLPLDCPADRAAWDKFLGWMIEMKEILPYAVIDRADGKAKGFLWILEIRPAHGVFEVGFIVYSPGIQRSRAATEAIYLCAKYGFELGYRRFEWRCNNLNAPSKRAAERFGFTFEGILRQQQVLKGRNRDTAYYSMLDSEWPARKQAYERWLAPDNFDKDGRQKVSLSGLQRGAA